MSYFNAFKLPLTIARPFNTYGPRQSARAVIPTIITQIASGLKEIRFDEQLKLDSTKIIKDAVVTMLPQNKHRALRMARLFIYKGADHKQSGQKPIEIKF
jgi:nucleoside-diphosphate-sugar epimerase